MYVLGFMSTKKYSVPVRASWSEPYENFLVEPAAQMSCRFANDVYVDATHAGVLLPTNDEYSNVKESQRGGESPLFSRPWVCVCSDERD